MVATCRATYHPSRQPGAGILRTATLVAALRPGPSNVPPPTPFHFAYSAPCPKRCWTLLLLFLRVPFHLLPLHPPDYPPVRTPSSHVSPQEVRPVDKNGGYKHCGASFGIQGIVVRSTRAHMGARASRQTRGGSTTTSWQSTTAPEPSNPRTACACTRTTMFCQLPALLAPTEPLTCAVS